MSEIWLPEELRRNAAADLRSSRRGRHNQSSRCPHDEGLDLARMHSTVAIGEVCD